MGQGKLMKFSIERAVLVKAVSQAQSVVERRNTIPILANVLIEATPEGVSFRATDLDTEVVDRAVAQVERPGATTVSAVMLNEIARKLPDGALVQLASDDASGRLSVQAGRSSFSLATLPRADFPVMATSEYSANFKAPASVLRRLFDKSKFAISTEETRYYLNGVYMHVAQSEDGPVLRCVATDGHRLARIDAPLPANADAMPGVIVPRKTVGELRKLLDDDEAEIAVSVSETKVRFAGAAEEELIVAYADEPLEIGFNAKYLQEIAGQVDRDNAVFLFNGSGDAALIREGSDLSAVYVVMPMRV